MYEGRVVSGEVFIVDDIDADLVRNSKWRLSGSRGKSVTRAVRRNGKSLTEYLHRIIMQAPDGLEVDHINGDRFDNRRSNLRLATRSQNEQNRRKAQSSSKTGMRGVEEIKPGHFSAYIYLHGKHIRARGHHKTIKAAAVAAADLRRRFMTHAPECAP